MIENINMKICRLCMNTGTLINIFQAKEDICLQTKILCCLNINLQPGDGLSSLICGACVENINNFYNYKQKCLHIYEKLKSVSQSSFQPPHQDVLINFNDSTDIEGNFKSESLIKVEIESDFIDNADSIPKKSLHKDFLSDLKAESDSETEVYPDTDNSNIKLELPQSQILKKLYSFSKKMRQKSLKTYQCELCGRIFKFKAVFQNHLTTHTGEKLFSCKVCAKAFTRAEHKMVHMRTHLGIRPYICEICGRSFTKCQDLSRHMKIHSDERNYSCPRCDRKFKRSGDVRSHMRTHTGARPFKCEPCEKSYTSHSGLRKHFKTHVNEHENNSRC